MRLFEIDNIKNFMRELFISNLFDELEVRQVTLRTKFTLSAEGALNRDFLSAEEAETSPSYIKYIKWKEIKPIAADFIKGDRPPLGIKIVFSLSEAKREKLLPEAKALFLNVNYSSSKLSLTTGTALKFFSTDRKYDAFWDEYIEKFLKKNNLI